MISHVAVADLDRDGLADVLVCDAFRNLVAWVRQAPARHLHRADDRAGAPHPAHVEAVDVDRDGDLDLLVAALGFLHPNNARDRRRAGARERRPPALHRAYAGGRRGARRRRARGRPRRRRRSRRERRRLRLRRRRDQLAREHRRLALRARTCCSGCRAASTRVPADVDGDGRPIIVSLISQEWEEIWAFVNDGGGASRRGCCGAPPTPTSARAGSRWSIWIATAIPISCMPTATPSSTRRRTAGRGRACSGSRTTGSSASSCTGWSACRARPAREAADLDGDGDLDVLLVTANNDWDNPRAASLLWLENDGTMRFTLHDIATVAHASQHGGRRRPRRRRPARRGDRRHAHQPAVRSARPGDTVDAAR